MPHLYPCPPFPWHDSVRAATDYQVAALGHRYSASDGVDDDFSDHRRVLLLRSIMEDLLPHQGIRAARAARKAADPGTFQFLCHSLS